MVGVTGSRANKGTTLKEKTDRANAPAVAPVTHYLNTINNSFPQKKLGVRPSCAADLKKIKTSWASVCWLTVATSQQYPHEPAKSARAQEHVISGKIGRDKGVLNPMAIQLKPRTGGGQGAKRLLSLLRPRSCPEYDGN